MSTIASYLEELIVKKPGNSNLFFFGLILSLSMALFSCGNEVAPQGGPRDYTAPVILSMKPENNSVQFSEKEFQINFDEFIKLVNPKKNIFISPPLGYPLKTQIKGKRLFVSFSDTLKDSVTYIFNFNKAVKDNHENKPSNTIQYFNYTFSTGNYIDSLSMNGRITNAFTGEGEKNVFVLLHSDTSDSALQLNRPMYITVTDDFGNFEFTHLKAGHYYAYALSDENSNYIYDIASERIAFSDSMVTVADTSDTVNLELFEEKSYHFYMEKKFSRGVGKFQYLPNAIDDSITICALDSSKENYSVRYRKDTIDLWVHHFVSDTFPLIFVAYNDTIDTLLVYNDSITIDSVKEVQESIHFIAANQVDVLDPSTDLWLSLSQPIQGINPSKIRLYEGDFRHEFDTIVISDDRLSIRLDFKRQFAMQYEIEIMDSFIHNFYGQVNDSLSYKFRVKEEGAYSSLQLQFDVPDSNYIVELFSGKSAIDTFFVFGMDTVELPYISEGEYTLRFTEDLNNNHIWDTGKLSSRRKPEKVFKHEQVITIPKNFDIVQDIKLD